MDNINDSGIKDVRATESKAAVVNAELRSRMRELDRRLEHLAEQRTALMEVRDAIGEEEQILARNMILAQKNFDQLKEEVDTQKQKVLAMETEVEELKREINILNRRCVANDIRKRELEVALVAADDDIVATKGEIFGVEEELEDGHAALVRIDRKLSMARLKS
jgi:chromosome segregation ATPase